MMVIKSIVWYNIDACESLFALIKRSIQIWSKIVERHFIYNSFLLFYSKYLIELP